jgi:hypothetical protein
MDGAGVAISNGIQLSFVVNPVMANAGLAWSQGAFVGANTALYTSWSFRIKNSFSAPFP